MTETMERAFAPLDEREIEHNNDVRRGAAPREEWSVILPAPQDAPDLTNVMLRQFAPAGYALTTGWRYRDEEGRLLGYAVRFDRPANGKPADKQVVPLSFCEHDDGRRQWRMKAFPAQRPLYGLDRLAERPAAPVLVVEGEKAADAAAERFPNMVVVTSPGGSKAAGKADWSSLRGREVTIWPDADKSGLTYADDVARLALAAGAKAVRKVVVPLTFPPSWDLADMLPAGAGDADLAAMLATAEKVADPNAWPALLPIVSTLPPVMPFSPELLPEALRDFVLDVAERQQSAPDFAAVAALCGIAAVVGNKVRIRPKQHDDWEVVPNLWGAIIGRPSAMKSPAMQSALAPLYALQDELRKEWEAECRDLAVEGALAGLDSKEAKKGAAKALKSGDRDEAKRLLTVANGGEEETPPCPRLIVNDATVEKLGELLNENPNGLLLVRDELPGFLARMESEEHQSERAFYLEAFNGTGSFTYDRIGRGTVHIDNCTMSIIGGVQPSRIAPIVRGALSGASNDGLIQRLQMAVWPDDRAGWTWVDRRPQMLARQAFEGAFRSLQEIRPADDGKHLILRFSEAAQEMFREWMTEIHREARSTVSPVLEAHIQKMPKTVASLALLFELIDGGRESVGEVSVARALDWADYLRTHANRLYAAGQTMADDAARLIVERRHQLPDPFTARAVHQKGWAGLSDRDVVSAAIETLMATHHCREATTSADATGGRPTTSYTWNPSLKVEG